MKVTTIARTGLVDLPASVEGTPFQERADADILTGAQTGPDVLGEFAGRACYKAWHLKNPDTEENPGYLGNIQSQTHFSVLEHAHVSIFVEDVSRALLLELERHRHASFSVESQRYVNTGKHHPEPVLPPAFEGDAILEGNLRAHYAKSLRLYDDAFRTLRDKGYPLKKAREAARSFLPNSTPVDFLVTANLRAWRDILGKRWAEPADEEIREFSGLVLGELRRVAPNSFQDIPAEPYA